MNILIFSYRFYPDFGGIESISQMLADHFVKRGHLVKVLTHSVQPKELPSFSYEIIYRPSFRNTCHAIAWSDAVLESNPCLTLSYPMLFFRKKHIIVLQTWLSRPNGKKSKADLLKRAWLRKATHVVACSGVIKDDSYDNAVVIGNSYDSSIFTIDANIQRDKDFVFLGRFVSDKGIDLAIKAFKKMLELSDGDITSSLTLIGDGEQMNELKQLAATLNIQDKVFFTGKMSGRELVAELNRHRYLLVPSLWKEPFGIVALEGMACGCWPIVADGGGLPEAIGNLGTVFTRGDVNDLSEKMLSVKRKNVLLTDQWTDVQQHLREHTVDRVGDAYLKLLGNIPF